MLCKSPLGDLGGNKLSNYEFLNSSFLMYLNF